MPEPPAPDCVPWFHTVGPAGGCYLYIPLVLVAALAALVRTPFEGIEDACLSIIVRLPPRKDSG